MTTDEILKLTDTCVKCGLCLPHCPTYRKTALEPDSPRGRIALVQGFLSGTLPDSHRLADRLDRCLECHACELACPSKVPVTRIIDAIRALRVERHIGYGRKLRRILLNTAVRPAMLIPWMRYYQNSWLSTRLQTSGVLRYLGLEHANQLLPKRPLISLRTGIFFASTASPIVTTDNTGEEIALFTGCLGRFLDAAVLQAALTILTNLGYTVSIPDQPCCCGALHRHDGFAAHGDHELAASANLFAKYTKVLTVASACLGELRQDPNLATRVDDATHFIATIPWPSEFTLNANEQAVWIHTPCTQRHQPGNMHAARELLARIPGITTIELEENEFCCGAAGTYMLRQPRLSQALLADKLRIIENASATTVVTTNTGCALHLAAGLNARGLQVQICHPLEILAERLTNSQNSL